MAKYLRGGLGAVLLFAVVIRVSAEVVTPAIPVIAMALVMAVIISVIINRLFRY